ncbi:HAD-IA family hydrolase [Mycolicibacter sinensis]|uniref:HAD-IA family hydrolase n=1 Tax=Mycolicibacter sinensis (strain JDM601) TaxID=875328 RepID=UPI0013F4CD05
MRSSPQWSVCASGPRIYGLVLERCGRPAQECVFIDDSEANLGPARALGIRSIHHQGPATTIAQLNAIFG